jgi:hypothetical protein
MVSWGRRGFVSLGDQALLFGAAVRGVFQRPFRPGVSGRRRGGPEQGPTAGSGG